VSLVSTHIRELGACRRAIAWSESYDDLPTAWDACERGDWLLWYAAWTGVDRRLVVRAACACARTALRYVPEGEDRPLRAIETAEAWTRGEATIEDVRRTAAAAAAYAYASADAAAYAAVYAAYAAAFAAFAASAAYAADAASAYAARAADTAAAATRAAYAAAALREMAILIRETLPRPAVLP
jgi:hypothetical protein